jgi:hypothetical protein
MRSLLPALIIFLFVAESKSIFAQATNTPPPSQPGSHELAAVSFLTPAQQEQYAKARAQALTDNPDLKAGGDTLKTEAESDPSTMTSTDFIEKMRSHRQKLRAAMLKVDPTLGPVFSAIDKHISEVKAQGANPASSGSGGSSSH